MTRALIFLALLGACAPRDNQGQHFGPQMPACIISCRAGIDAVNAQPDSIINTAPRPAAAPATR